MSSLLKRMCQHAFPVAWLLFVSSFQIQSFLSFSFLIHFVWFGGLFSLEMTNYDTFLINWGNLSPMQAIACFCPLNNASDVHLMNCHAPFFNRTFHNSNDIRIECHLLVSCCNDCLKWDILFRGFAFQFTFPLVAFFLSWNHIFDIFQMNNFFIGRNELFSAFSSLNIIHWLLLSFSDRTNYLKLNSSCEVKNIANYAMQMDSLK